jgi:hypothetical protein
VLYAQVLKVAACLRCSVTLFLPPALLHILSTSYIDLDMAPFKTLEKQAPKVSPCHIAQRFLVNCMVSYYQSRASSDTVWVHDRAPGTPRAATQSSDVTAPLNNKLMVTNLHYEITPKDLTVCPVISYFIRVS